MNLCNYSGGIFQPKPRKVILELTILLILITVGLYIRRPDSFRYPQLWAEDGSVFLQQNLELGLSSIITPYAGYLHTFPRLVSIFATKVNPDLYYVAVIFNASFYLLICAVSVMIYFMSKQLGITHRIVFSSLIVYLPIGAEMYMNLTNSIWVSALIPIIFLLIGYKWYNDGHLIVRVLVAVLLILSCLTGPFSLLLTPLVMLILFKNKKKITIKNSFPYLLIILCGLVQLYFIKSSGGVSRALQTTNEPNHLWLLLVNNFRELFFFSFDVKSLVPYFIFNAIIIAVAILFLLFIYKSYNKIKFERKLVLILTPFFFIGSFIIAFWPSEHLVTGLGCPRYYFVPEVCIAWYIMFAVDKYINYRDLIFYYLFLSFHLKYESSILPDKNWKKQLLEVRNKQKNEIDINPEGWKIRFEK